MSECLRLLTRKEDQNSYRKIVRIFAALDADMTPEEKNLVKRQSIPVDVKDRILQRFINKQIGIEHTLPIAKKIMSKSIFTVYNMFKDW